MAYELNQLFIAESFHALYMDGRGRSTLSRQDLQARQELCEDLAQSLSKHCLGLQFRNDALPPDVLTEVHTGLMTPSSSLPEPEARWVTIRTAELLRWDVPAFLRDEPCIGSAG